MPPRRRRSSSRPSACPADISYGQHNGCVTELQELLNKHGAHLGVDGDFGPATLAAVKSYQSGHGLSVDGIVGPKTKASLDGTSTPPASEPRPLDQLRLRAPGPRRRRLAAEHEQHHHDGAVDGQRGAGLALVGPQQPAEQRLGSGGGAGLGSYSNLVVAAHYVAANLNGGPGDYGHITADLRASAAPSVTEKAIWGSPWASSHYGHGRDFYKGHPATVAAPSGDW